MVLLLELIHWYILNYSYVYYLHDFRCICVIMLWISQRPTTITCVILFANIVQTLSQCNFHHFFLRYLILDYLRLKWLQAQNSNSKNSNSFFDVIRISLYIYSKPIYMFLLLVNELILIHGRLPIIPQSSIKWFSSIISKIGLRFICIQNSLLLIVAKISLFCQLSCRVA